MGIKIIANNRKAFHEYHIHDKFEAGIALVGSEVKSIRAGKVNLKEGWVEITEDGNAFLRDCHISKYTYGHHENHEETRRRPLLLHTRELARLSQAVDEKGMTVVPLKIYIKGQRIKLEIGIAKGKKLYDKRAAQKKKEADREMERALKNRA